MNTQKAQEDHGKNQAAAQIESIIEMVEALETASDEGRETGIEEEREAAEQRIQEDPLSVEIRSGWHTPGNDDNSSAEFQILLCWGGPSCRIIGDLDNGQPEKPRLQYQDWFTAWTDYPLTEEEEAALLTYCQQFYFGE